jgi:hypothetical protein
MEWQLRYLMAGEAYKAPMAGSVPIPPDGRGLQGTDGRMVAIPSGCRGLEGPDGRMVAIHPGKRAVADAKGRMRNK